MKKIFILLLVIGARCWAAYAAGTTGLYDFEQNLSDTTGVNNGTPSGSVTYGTTNGIWHGTYNLGGTANGSILPAAVLGSSGTLEFSWRSPVALTNGDIVWSSKTAADTRSHEIYIFGGQLYAYGNGTNGTNTVFSTPSINTNYYIKDTWQNAVRQIWMGTWTVAGTVTLSKVFDSSGCSLTSVSNAYLLTNSLGASGQGNMDWARFRNVYDNTATVTLDPATVNTNRTMDLDLFLYPSVSLMFHWLFLPSELGAHTQNQLIEQGQVNFFDVKTKTLAAAKVLSDGIKSGKITFTPTPTPETEVPTATPTPTGGKIKVGP